MSTVAPPPPPARPPGLDLGVDREMIDREIDRTRRTLKWVDFSAGLLTLVIGVLGFLLVAAVLDHWIVPGGLGGSGRLALFAVLALGVAWHVGRTFVPLFRQINPVYAAHAIESHSPSLKNSLINLLLFRSRRQAMSAKVYAALEHQTAQRLSTAMLDAAVDRSALLRLGYALLAIVAAIALYGALSPKNIAVSAGRVLAPWADLAAPSRVQIHDVRPGTASVARGERVEISAEVLGATDADPLRLHWSTADRQIVDETVPMARGEGTGRIAVHLPRAAGAGVEQDLVYWIEAGDARSKPFKLTVYSRPTIVVQKVRYEPPAYTGYGSSEVNNTGDIRGLEGTRVTIDALSNQQLRSAAIDFDADGRPDAPMQVNGDRASATFTLALRKDRRTPQHPAYALRLVTVDGRVNDDPATYRIEVTADYAPEVRITQPEEPETTARPSEIMLIGVEARDVDFALSQVRLAGRVGDRDVVLGDMLTEATEGRFAGIKPFAPESVGLKPGDLLEYWAEARDNRRPDANVTESDRRRLRIVGEQAGAQQNQQRPGGQGGNQPQNGGGDSQQQNNGGENPQQNQRGGGSDQQQQQDAQSPPGEQGNNQPQPGVGGAGQGEGQQPDAQSQPGGGQAGNQQQGGGGQQQQDGPSGGGNQQQDGQQQDGQQPNGGGQSGSQQSGADNAAPQPPGDSSPPGANGSPAQPGQSGSSTGQNQPQAPVSSAGDDDGTAFQRIAQRLDQQDANDGKQQGQDQPPGEQPSAANRGSQANNQNSATGRENSAKNNAEQSAGQDPNAEPNRQPAAGGPPKSGDSPRQTNSNGAEAGEKSTNQSSSPDAAASPAQSDPGAGDATGQEQGAPQGDQLKKPTDKQVSRDAKSAQQSAADAGAESKSQKQSDARGPTGGDRSGGGQEGAGQRADSEGRGESGQNEAADEGAGQAAEEGAGQSTDRAGKDQLAEGQTGKSSGDQPGGGQESGSTGQESQGAQGGSDKQTGEESAGGADQKSTGGDRGASANRPGESAAGGQPPFDQRNSSPSGEQASQEQGGQRQTDASQGQQAAGKQNAEPGAQGAQPAGADPTEQPGQQGDTPPAGKQPAEKSAPADASKSPPAGEGEDGEAKSPPSDGNASSTKTPQGGAATRAANSPATGWKPNEDQTADAANLDFARQKTDMILERLDDQLKQHRVDPELLRSLGWSEDELRRFVDRWRGLKDRAAGDGDDAAEARDQLDAALRSLGLRTGGLGRLRATADADQLRDLREGYRIRAPREYADRVREYVKGASSAND